MKKVLTIFLFFLLAAVAVLAFLRLRVPESPAVSPPPTYDSTLYDDFLAAWDSSDYIAMNTAYERNMEKTGVSFPIDDYDSTHGGLIYTYPYSVTLNGNDETVRGNLYIVSTELDREAQTIGENDYFAVDRRDRSDPEFVVIASYRANTDGIIRQLCQLLLDHEGAYPSDWDRTLDSMVEEWEMHNLAYSMDYKPDHSADVNLNNADEETNWLRRAMEEFR